MKTWADLAVALAVMGWPLWEFAKAFASEGDMFEGALSGARPGEGQADHSTGGSHV